MIHRITVLLLTLMLSISCFSQETPNEQDSIEATFVVVIPKERSLNAEQRIEIKNKLESVLARLQCAGDVKKTPFVMVPEINITGTNMSAGTKEAFTLIEGELVLIVKNRYNGTAYNELVLPLRKLVKGKVKDPKSELIQEINPKDKQFVRFIRNTQQRIVEQYSDTYIDVP